MQYFTIKIGNKKFDIIQDNDEKFILPDELRELNSIGSALKPANEPIVVARKPLAEDTVAQNVLKYGTGGINIDECRIAGPEPHHNYGRTSGENSFVGKSENASVTPANGRWPANVILECTCESVERRVQNSEPYVYSNNEYDVAGYIAKCKPNAPSNYNDKDSFVIHTNPDCPCLILDQQSGITKSGLMRAGQKRNIGYGGYNGNMPSTATEKDTYADCGGASRFFYVAKASRKERDAGLENSETKLFGQSSLALTKIKNGETEYLQENHIGLNKIKTVKNNHPTVKPIELMRYLIRLVTPQDGIVLDPFAGSGTTGIAAKLEQFNFIGIEKEEDYCSIANARIAAYQPEDIQDNLFRHKYGGQVDEAI